ncbi:MAG: formate dehydrogenase subunit alpha, partial [Rhodocyclaceae bacterium]|nr:formate dehydrogenase subunit alpha [Rhodocyclaceae bacterium]
DRQSGLDWKRRPPREVYEEMRATMPSVAGISWTRLERESAVGYPCPDESAPPQAVLFEHSFPTTDGRARFVPAHFARADELPDADYPLVLITGRTLEHWHTGAMTRRAAVLDALQPQAYAAFHPEDLAGAALVDGQTVRLQTRRGSVTARAVADAAMARGQVFMPFCYAEAAANLLTNDALDPFGKIPEFKFCALRVSAAETA